MPEIKGTVELSFSVYCARCGAGLCGQTTVRSDDMVRVEPCEACLKDEHKDGYDEGYSDGQDQAKEEES